jgi:hypothetical protein
MPLRTVVRAVRSGVGLIVLSGDVNEVFTQNYRYTSLIGWLGSAFSGLKVQFLTDASPATAHALLVEETKPLLVLNPELLFQDNPAGVIAMIQSRLGATGSAGPLLLNFSVPSTIPDELYSPRLNSVFVQIARLTSVDPEPLLSRYLEQHKLTAALDDIKPALKGLSNQDILHCLERIVKGGQEITTHAVLGQKLNLLRARYNRLGAVVEAPPTPETLVIQPELRQYLEDMTRHAPPGGVSRSRRIAFFGIHVAPIMEACARRLGLVAIRIEHLIQDTVAETSRTLDQLEELIFTQPGCAVLLSPYELVVPLEQHLPQGTTQAQLVHKRFTDILDRMGRAEQTASLFIGTRKPSTLGLELILKFPIRIPVLPITSPTIALDVLRAVAAARHIDVTGVSLPPAADLVLTSLHVDSVLDDIATRRGAGQTLDDGVWRTLPPTDSVDAISHEAIRWGNVVLEYQR